MNIALKNIVVDHELSEVTHYFTADLYIDGHRAVRIHDKGWGDDFEIRPYDRRGTVLYEEAKQWCLDHQDMMVTAYKMEPITSDPIDLEDLVSDLLQRHIEGKLLDEHSAEMQTAMINAIVYGVPDKLLYHRLLLDHPVELLLSTKTGTNNLRRTIIDRVLPRMTEGERILNTNIEAETLHKMRVPAERIQGATPAPEKKHRVKKKSTGTKSVPAKGKARKK